MREREMSHGAQAAATSDDAKGRVAARRLTTWRLYPGFRSLGSAFRNIHRRAKTPKEMN